MVKEMAHQPLILALANPNPEIRPELAKEIRDDAIIATGRSDYPNQVNNVLCFPFLFRGALDVGATTINDEMKLACVNALSKLAYRVNAIALLVTCSLTTIGRLLNPANQCKANLSEAVINKDVRTLRFNAEVANNVK